MNSSYTLKPIYHAEQAQLAETFLNRVLRWKHTFGPTGSWSLLPLVLIWFLFEFIDPQDISTQSFILIFSSISMWPRPSRRGWKPSFEIMRPVHRRDLFIEIIVAWCIRMFQQWMILTGILILLAFTLNWQLWLRTSWFAVAMITFSLNVLSSTIVIYLERHPYGPRLSLYFVSSSILICLGGFLLKHSNMVAIFIATTLMTGAAVMVAIAAYHRWIDEELA